MTLLPSSLRIFLAMPLRFRAMLLACLTAMLAACGADTDKALEDFAYVPPPAHLAGRVSDALTSDPIVGASIRVDDMTTTTDAEGRFLFEDVSVSHETLVRVTAAGYARTTLVTNTVHGLTAEVTARLLPVGATTTINPAAGGSLAQPGSTADADLPANALVDADGNAVTATVTLALTAINMTSSISSAPGDFASNAGEPIEGYGALQLTAQAGGDDVQLAAGQTATIRIPFSSRNDAAAPVSLPLMRFDETTGHWEQSSIAATLGGATPDQYYEASVDQLGTWMVSTVINPSVNLTGCIVHEGGAAPAANVRVQAEGITYSGISYAITDGAGCFTLKVKPNSQVVVNGVYGKRLTNSLAPSIGATGARLDSNLVLYSLSGAPRITLSWGKDPSDIDSHIFAPDGTHVYYSSKGSLSADPYIALDVDDVTSYGPEVVTITRLMVGTYTYGTRLFSGSGTQTASPVRVELRLGDEVRVFTPTGTELGSDDWWTVFQLVVDSSCNVTVVPVGVFSPGSDSGPTTPARPAPVARTYCNP